MFATDPLVDCVAPRVECMNCDDDMEIDYFSIKESIYTVSLSIQKFALIFEFRSFHPCESPNHTNDNLFIIYLYMYLYIQYVFVLRAHNRPYPRGFLERKLRIKISYILSLTLYINQ